MSDSQVPFSTLGAPVGHVAKSSGLVKVESIGQEERLVKEGWPVFFGETVVTNSTSSVIIAFNNGEEIVMGPRSSIEVSDELFLIESVASPQVDPTESIDALQEAILAGADPSLIQEAPAAGEDVIEGQHRIDVAIERNNEGALPSYGYDTDRGFLSADALEPRLITSNGSEDSVIDKSIGSVAFSVESAGVDGVYNALELGADNLVSLTMSVDGSNVGDTLTYSVDGGEPVVVVLTEEDIENGVVIELAPSSSVSASLSDDAGNASETGRFVVPSSDTVPEAGTVIVDAITADDVINGAESTTTNILVTGTATGGDISENDQVNLVINGTTYTTNVASDGTWSVNVLGSDLAADTSFDVVVTSSDDAGNVIDSIGSSTHSVDLVAEAGTVIVDAITADDVINGAESTTTNILVTGTATGGDISENDQVNLVINGTTYTTNVASDGTWSVNVLGSDLAADTSFDAVVTSSDDAGNVIDSIGSSTYSVDLVAEAGTVIVDAITADDVINGAESTTTNIVVTGTATGGDISENDQVNLVINGTTYTTNVASDGTWSVNVLGSDLAADTSFDAVVTSSDDAGNVIDSIGSSTHSVDLVAEAGTVIIDAITADDVINGAESTTTNILVTGTATGGDISENDQVNLVINGTTYTTNVASDGTWSVNVLGSDLAAGTSFDAVVTSSDDAGNVIDSIGSSTHSVDVRAFGQIDVDRITGDGIINAQDVADGNMVAITGYVGNDATAGDTLTVSLNGVVIGTGTVSSEQNADGKYLYSVDVLGSDLANIRTTTATLVVSVSGTDNAGNPFTTQSTEIFSVDLYADVDVFVEDANYDEVITEGEEGSVKVGGFLEFDGAITSINITDSRGNVLTITEDIYVEYYGDYSYFEDDIDVSGLADGELTVVVNVVDAEGVAGTSEPETITKDSDHVTYLGDTDSVEVRIAQIGEVKDSSNGTSVDDDLRGSEASDAVEGFAGDDVLIGNGGSDVLNGGEGNDILIGGSITVGDGEVDTLTGGNGDDIFVLQNTLALDHITDFNAQEDKLDLTALLTGLSDNPGEGADTSAIEDFLSANIQVTDKRVTIDGDDVATFGSESNFDSNVDGAVSGFDSITVIFNDQEYSINIDG